MFEFLTFVVAILAIVIAAKARGEAKEARALLSAMAIRLARAEERADRASEAAPPPQQEADAPAPPPVVVPPAPHVEEAPVATPAAEPLPPAPPVAPAIPPYTPPAAPAPAAAKAAIDWESLVGIKLFGWIAGIALVLAAVFLFKYSVEHGWLRPAVRAVFGFVTGIGLLVVCELRVARNYRLTANAMLGAGIAILYATLFALHGRWQLWPASAAFGGMLIVTAAAVYLSTRRDSVFIALLGLIGGFATPALLSSGENRPIALFSYLLLLNGGISWIAFRKRWPLLTALSVALTAIYQWAWVERFLTTGQLPLAAAIFLVFALAAAVMVWQQGEGDARQRLFRWIGAAGAVLPLLFAFFTAIVPEYGARYNVLFGFLLLIASGLAAIALWRGPRWLHSLGALAVLLTFFIWLTVSYTKTSWPWSLVWLFAFVALYLGVRTKLESVAVYAAPLLFFVFIGLAVREPAESRLLAGAMLAMLVFLIGFASRIPQWRLVPIALALSSIAMMSIDRVAWPLYAGTQILLFALLFAVAWIRRAHWLSLAALPFFIAAVMVADVFLEARQLALGAILYALFLLYPVVLRSRLGTSVLPHLGASLASVLFFLLAMAHRETLGFSDWAGAVPLVQGLLLFGLLILQFRYERVAARDAVLANTILAAFAVAIAVQITDSWMAAGWAVQAAALAWLYTRLRHPLLLWWTAGLSLAALLRLLPDPRFDGYVAVYLICAAAAFFVTRIVRELRPLTASLGTLELFVLLNVAIYDYYDQRVAASSLANDLTYTIAWLLFAIAMLVAGIVLHTRAARVAALGLMVITVLKCFLHDLGNLGGLYRVASLFGLAVSLVLVGIVLQRFVIMKREPVPPPAPAGES